MMGREAANFYRLRFGRPLWFLLGASLSSWGWLNPYLALFLTIAVPGLILTARVVARDIETGRRFYRPAQQQRREPPS